MILIPNHRTGPQQRLHALRPPVIPHLQSNLQPRPKHGLGVVLTTCKAHETRGNSAKRELAVAQALEVQFSELVAEGREEGQDSGPVVFYFFVV